MQRPNAVSRSRVAWRCRRGMRELDLLLERFLEDGLAELDEGEIRAFERLLDCADQDLLAWLGASDPPACGEHEPIVRRIRAAVRKA